MTTDYNLISKLYKKAKEQPWRTAVETYSLMGLVGDLAGKSVIDVACGEGYFTRKLRRAGAARVLGFDISERMIELALAEEARDPLGIEYVVEDARRSRDVSSIWRWPRGCWCTPTTERSWARCVAAWSDC